MNALEKKEPTKAPIKKIIQQIPQEILNDPKLNEAIKYLPSNYNFEIHKTVWRLLDLKRQLKKHKLSVCLQFPEGLLMYACLITDILENFADSECIIMSDVTYGACCVDDYTAYELESDFLIHYGHSCLVPINETCIKTMYVFVEISIDTVHLAETIAKNFPDHAYRLHLLGTIQFNTALYETKSLLEEKGYKNLVVPQEKPRSGGEVLGCTSPKMSYESSGSYNSVVFISDGRFHMEAAMIANPKFLFFQYNPYSKLMTKEEYDNDLMMKIRGGEVKKCKNMKKVLIILGTLGRQGNPHILKKLEEKLNSKNVKFSVMLASELDLSQLKLIEKDFDCFVQIACPRLSVDWGLHFPKPLLNPYELFVVIEEINWKEVYPMDYYSSEGGEWTNYHHRQRQPSTKQPIRIEYEDK